MKTPIANKTLADVAWDVLYQLKSLSDLAPRAKGMSPEDHIALHCALKGAESDPFVEASAPLLQYIEDLDDTVIAEASYKNGIITLHALDFRQRDIPIPLSLFDISLQHVIESFGTSDYPNVDELLRLTHPSRPQPRLERHLSIVGL